MSTLRETALKVIDAYNSWDLEKMMAVRAPECIQEMRPGTLDLPGPMDNASYEAFQKSIMTAFHTFHIEVLEIIEDTARNKVAIWAKSNASSIIGPYENEYMLVFHMNEAGDKLVRLREFADSAYALDFFPKLRAFKKPGADA
ncbi:hypothetical protein B0T16DRAFT_456262 [Cercophora newfieldiana]|uniref:SnoaL-like domain-containing protein n=1 Tax=Cercophora newfieldiana TaxID=92897 RepID=A0AA39YC79_9PEZI|nr:hypothetical protein B0T16DRAFT_456262 [Cercophora newfieldiana]